MFYFQIKLKINTDLYVICEFTVLTVQQAKGPPSTLISNARKRQATRSQVCLLLFCSFWLTDFYNNSITVYFTLEDTLRGSENLYKSFPPKT